MGFKEFFYTLYFQNHLLKHFYQPYKIIMCISKTVNLEVLNLLNILTHKYSFLKLRQSEPQNLKIDLEQNYLLNSNLKDSRIMTSNTCLLIGVNPRYEGSKLNLKLRSRYLKGNFNVIQIGSLLNLTFSSTNITSNIKILRSLIERINLFSRSKNQNQLNVLNATLNDVGFLNYNGMKSVEYSDFKNSIGVYFINNSFSTSNIKKLLNLKLLNFFKSHKSDNKLLITQN